MSFAEAYKDKGTTTAPANDIDFVLNRYKTLHSLRRIGAKQREIVERALTSGRTADELVAAVEANAADQWHRDHDKHELSYVLADGMIDTFIALKHDQATAST